MGMLVLSRHRDEAITIGDDVRVIVVDIRGDKVRLGIEAPQAVPVHRQEVYEAIQREREATNNASDSPVPFVFGIVLRHRSDEAERRVTVIESLNSEAALSQATKRFNSLAYPGVLASVQCFGEATDGSRDEAAKWMFAKWVDHHEPFRVA